MQDKDGSEGWGEPLGWNSANGAGLPGAKRPRQPGWVPGSRKAAEQLLPESDFNPGTLEKRAPWEWPLPVDYGALFAPIAFMKQRLG